MCADIIYCCKMTSVMVLDGVTPFLSLKALQIHVNIWDTVQLVAGIIQCNGRKLEEAEDFKCVLPIHCELESK